MVGVCVQCVIYLPDIFTTLTHAEANEDIVFGLKLGNTFSVGGCTEKSLHLLGPNIRQLEWSGYIKPKVVCCFGNLWRLSNIQLSLPRAWK